MDSDAEEADGEEADGEDCDAEDSDAGKPDAEEPDAEQIAGSCCCLPHEHGLQMPRSDSSEANQWFY
ncbi:MAG TPA: hypothetical protein DDY43_04455 [Synechococcales bacterium UBA10510]|nr:hypothetical protein [Synechococcales bacterium UBA10510]